MMPRSDRELEYLDEDIARLRRRISEKERAEGDGRVVDRAVWSASLKALRERLAGLERERAKMTDEVVS
jgi:hypothetical protein